MNWVLIFTISASIFFTSGNMQRNVPSEIRFHGVKIKTHDLSESKAFYVESLGFEIEKEYKNDLIKLSSSTVPVYLSKALKTSGIAHTTISLQVNKLLPVIDSYRVKGVKMDDSSLQRNGVGIHINFEDPSGNKLSLMEVQIFDAPEVKEPQIYNVGISTNDVEGAEVFYTKKMGFEVFSRNYLPKALPLKHSDNSFAFMIHKNEEIAASPAVSYPDESQIVFLFESKDLEKTRDELTKRGIDFVFENPKKDALGSYIAFYDNLGNVFEIYEFH